MAQRKVDPITVLRDAFTSNAKITLSDNMLVFGSQIKLPIDTPTAWQPSDNNKRYSVGDLWLLLDSKKNGMTNYYQRISEYSGKIQMISMQHHSKLKRRNRRLLHGQKGLFRMY